MGGSLEGNRPSMEALLPDTFHRVEQAAIAALTYISHASKFRSLREEGMQNETLQREEQILPLTIEYERGRLMRLKNPTIYDLAALQWIKQNPNGS